MLVYIQVAAKHDGSFLDLCVNYSLIPSKGLYHGGTRRGALLSSSFSV